MAAMTPSTSTALSDPAQRLAVVEARIARCLEQCGRSAGCVALLAVSKTFPVEAVDALAAAGQNAFGENYAQEGVEKAIARPALDWHFIGPLQSNKTRGIAEHFSWVHSIDRLKIAERLSAQRPVELPPLHVCVQVNIDGEATKSGCAPSEALALCQAIAALPQLQLRGLMAIPEPTSDTSTQRCNFAALRALRDAINDADASLKLDTLSMGMSDDLESAIIEGATIVRVGSAIFGPRTYTNNSATEL
jgi:pyridoxal phosphate enzyme (YggS family)